MKKITKILLSIALIFSVLPFSGVAADNETPTRAKGLYVAQYDFENENFNSNNHIRSDLYMEYGSNQCVQFYYYDGQSKYTLIDDSDAISFPSEITEVKETTMNSKKVMELNASTIFEGSISYTIDSITYNIPVSCKLPNFGIYNSNSATVDNYVSNITADNAGNLYLIPRESGVSIKSVSFKNYSDGTNANGSESIVYDKDTYKISFTNISFGYGIVLTVKYSVQYEEDGETKSREEEQDVYLTSQVDNQNQYNLGTHSYGGKEYTYGIAMNDEENNLILTNGNGSDSPSEDSTYKFYLVIGDLSGAYAVAAPKKLFDEIQNVEYEIVDNTFGDGDLEIEIGNSKEANIFENNAYPVTITAKANSIGSALIKFTINCEDDTEKYTVITYQTFDLKQNVVVNISLDKTDMAEEKFNSYFGSYNSLIEHFGNVENIKNADIISIQLPNGTYSGDYEINDDNADVKLRIVGGDSSVIEGSLGIKSGTVEEISNIKFNGSGVSPISISSKVDSNPIISKKTVGLYANNSANTKGELTPNVATVINCTFTDYDYAIVSTDSGIVCDIIDCTFNSCTHGYYIDARGEHTNAGGSGSKDNKFINCTNGVSIISLPEQLPAYCWRFVDNYFINDGSTDYCDFNINENGTYYFRENYYGINDNNLRTVSIRKGSTITADVITNPCIRYPESEYKYGIDPADGLLLRIFSGVEMMINENDIDNIKNLSITNAKGDELLGTITID